MSNHNRPLCLAGVILAGLMLLSLAACDPGPGRAQLADIRERGELHVLTRNAPTTWYEDRDGPAGPEYEMVEAFAAHLGVEVRYELAGSVSEILQRVAEGEADIGAAGISRTRERGSNVRFGPVYQEVEQQVVCRRGGAGPQSAEDLVGLSLKVPAGTTYGRRLQQLAQVHPELAWEAAEGQTTEQMLAEVWRRQIDCTIADSNIVDINRRYFPELEVMFALGDPDHFAWVLPPAASGLHRELRRWFSEFERVGGLDAVIERYYGFVEVFDYVDMRAFQRRIEQRLPQYRPIFEQAGERYGFDWTLLAAQAYQESHWDPHARSPTGVRGMMMLTRRTAAAMEVSNRLDARESIMGGARYMQRLYRWLDEEIEEPDRTWVTLAVYNVGMGHFRDAQALARELGRNPHSWPDLRDTLPLLAQPEYYQRTRYGYARGSEPVRYVQRIRDYQDVLQRQLEQGER